MSNLTEKLWAVDIETGGLEIGCPIIEVAYGPVFNDIPACVLWNLDVRPEDCSQAALNVNHCFDPDRKFNPNTVFVHEVQMAYIIADALEGKVLIGQNTHFDASHIEALLKKHGLKRTWSYRLVNLSSLAVGYIAGRLSANGSTCKVPMPENGWSQQDAAYLVGTSPVEGDLAHTAAGDVENVRAIARKVLA